MLGIKCLVTKSQKASKRRCAQGLKILKGFYYLQCIQADQFLHSVPIINKILIHYVLVFSFYYFQNLCL